MEWAEKGEQKEDRPLRVEPREELGCRPARIRFRVGTKYVGVAVECPVRSR